MKHSDHSDTLNEKQTGMPPIRDGDQLGESNWWSNPTTPHRPMERGVFGAVVRKLRHLFQVEGHRTPQSDVADD